MLNDQTNTRIREEFEKEYHTKECLESEYINCICPKIPEIESIKEQFIQQYKSEFPPNTEIFRGMIADWWLSKIDELLKSQREDCADIIKRKFNGFGGTLGFTEKDLLSLIKDK